VPPEQHSSSLRQIWVPHDALHDAEPATPGAVNCWQHTPVAQSAVSLHEMLRPEQYAYGGKHFSTIPPSQPFVTQHEWPWATSQGLPLQGTVPGSLGGGGIIDPLSGAGGGVPPSSEGPEASELVVPPPSSAGIFMSPESSPSVFMPDPSSSVFMPLSSSVFVPPSSSVFTPVPPAQCARPRGARTTRGSNQGAEAMYRNMEDLPTYQL
jgi:hypothetical protein